MTIKEQLDKTMKDAMRAGDDVTRRTVRMVLAAIKQVEIDRQVTLDETGVTGILQKEIKTRRESLEEAKKANRPDLMQANEAEIQVLKAFLPAEMDDSELINMAQAAIQESGASAPADMGKVMKLLIPRLQGRAANDRISRVVQELLKK